MIQDGRYLLMNRQEFYNWLMNLKVSRAVTRIQEHHTWSPSYRDTSSSNQIALVKGMAAYHIRNNGYSDIAQHLSTFKDGLICTGRSFNLNPAGIYGFNTGAICIEHVGNFDWGGDTITAEHKETMLFMTAALAIKFNISISTRDIVYHHWFALSNGMRHNGTLDRLSKTCPGSGFFGGNNEPEATRNFIPGVQQKSLLAKYPQWQLECSQYLVNRGLTQSFHMPDEVITFGVFGYMMNNYFDKRPQVNPIRYLKEKGVIKDPHQYSEPMTMATLGYILMNTEKVTGCDPIQFLTNKGYITGQHAHSAPLTIWRFGAIMNSLMSKKPFQLSY